jgi:alkyl hydroperoxide reductase subunit AhpC
MSEKIENLNDGLSSLDTNLPPAASDSKQSHKPWYKTGQGWKAAIEIIGIAFAVGYAIVTYLQWQDLRHNFIVDERAWLGIKDITLVNPVELGKNYHSGG